MCGERCTGRNSGTGIAKVRGYNVNLKTAGQFTCSSVQSLFYYLYLHLHLMALR